MIVIVGLFVSGRKDNVLSRRKSRIGVGIPAPNDDVMMPIGTKMLTEAVFRAWSRRALRFPESRPEGRRLLGDGRLVENFLEMTRISMNRIDPILENEDVYGSMDCSVISNLIGLRLLR